MKQRTFMKTLLIKDSFGIVLTCIIANNFARHAIEPCKVRRFGIFYKICLDFT